MLDVAEGGLKPADLCNFSEIHLALRLLAHRADIVAGPPLRIVDYTAAFSAQHTRRDEAGLALHDLLGPGNQQGDQGGLGFRCTGERRDERDAGVVGPDDCLRCCRVFQRS